MSGLSGAARSVLTLAVLAVLVLLGASWGWSALTEPLPGSDEEAVDTGCTSVPVQPGDVVRSDMVEVSVLNAGTREGLAGEVMAGLVDQGFRQGSSGNAPAGTEVVRVQVWAADRRDPTVQLVLSTLGSKVPVVDREVNARGVVVVVGNAFQDVQDVRAKVKAKVPSTACEPLG